MKVAYSGRALALVVLAAGLTAGCVPHGYGVHHPSERVVVRAPAPAPPVRRVAVYNRADRDALAYTRQVAHAVRLSPAQQRRIHEQLSTNAFHLLDASHPRDHQYLYPFPRRANERQRVVQRFWRDADRAIERSLRGQQRRAYRDYVRYHYEGRYDARGRRR